MSCLHLWFLIVLIKNREQHLKYNKMTCEKMENENDFLNLFLKIITNVYVN
jgi:hypothetical protein